MQILEEGNILVVCLIYFAVCKKGNFASSRLQNNEMSENILCGNIEKDQAGWVGWWVCGGGVGSLSKSNSCHNEFPTGMSFPFYKGLIITLHHRSSTV